MGPPGDSSRALREETEVGPEPPDATTDPALYAASRGFRGRSPGPRRTLIQNQRAPTRAAKGPGECLAEVPERGRVEAYAAIADGYRRRRTSRAAGRRLVAGALAGALRRAPAANPTHTPNGRASAWLPRKRTLALSASGEPHTGEARGRGTEGRGRPRRRDRLVRELGRRLCHPRVRASPPFKPFYRAQ